MTSPRTDGAMIATALTHQEWQSCCSGADPARRHLSAAGLAVTGFCRGHDVVPTGFRVEPAGRSGWADAPVLRAATSAAATHHPAASSAYRRLPPPPAASAPSPSSGGSGRFQASAATRAVRFIAGATGWIVPAQPTPIPAERSRAIDAKQSGQGQAVPRGSVPQSGGGAIVTPAYGGGFYPVGIRVSGAARSVVTTADIFGAYDPWYGWFPTCMARATRRYRGYDGALRLKVKPVEASVCVDGYYVGVVDDFDGVFQRLPHRKGPHRIEIRAPQCETLALRRADHARRNNDVSTRARQTALDVCSAGL